MMNFSRSIYKYFNRGSEDSRCKISRSAVMEALIILVELQPPCTVWRRVTGFDRDPTNNWI